MSRKSQPLARESVTGAGLQVALEGQRPGFGTKGDIGPNLPRSVGPSAGALARIVIGEPLLEILAVADVPAIRNRLADEQVDVVHEPSAQHTAAAQA